MSQYTWLGKVFNKLLTWPPSTAEKVSSSTSSGSTRASTKEASQLARRAFWHHVLTYVLYMVILMESTGSSKSFVMFILARRMADLCYLDEQTRHAVSQTVRAQQQLICSISLHANRRRRRARPIQLQSQVALRTLTILRGSTLCALKWTVTALLT